MAALRSYTLRLLKLGDTWAAVSWLLQQQNVALTERTRAHGKSRSVRPLVTEIESLLSTGNDVHFVSGNAGERPPEEACFQHEYLPTKRGWIANESRLICIQVDGRWLPHRKNPSLAERVRLVEALQAAGYTVMPLGEPMRLSECVTALSECFCFIGVDSGMMHVANSVRCPRILLRNRMFLIERTYGGKALMIAADVEAALRLLI